MIVYDYATTHVNIPLTDEGEDQVGRGAERGPDPMTPQEKATRANATWSPWTLIGTSAVACGARHTQVMLVWTWSRWREVAEVKVEGPAGPQGAR